MNSRTMLFVAIAVSFAMVFSAASFSMQHVSNGSSTYNFVPNSETGVVLNGINVGPVNQMMHLNVMVTLKFRNQAMLSNLLYELQNPHSPMFHKFLSQSQFAQYFSPTSSEYYGYVAYFLSKGFTVHTYSDRISMTLGGTVSQFESVFHTTISNVRYHGRTFFAPVKELWLSYGLSGNIAGVVGLSNEFKAQIAPLFTGSGSGELLYGADMQAAYQLNKIYSAKGYPTNETIATILWSGTDSAGNSVAPFVPSDISYYFDHNLPPGEPRSTVYGYPIDGAPLPGPSAAKDTSQADFESTLDLEMAGSAAPGATVVEVYGPQATQTDLDQAFAAILNPSYNTTIDNALSHVVAISNSWGGSDMVDSTWNQYEQEAAARGITVLASSGDDGDTSNVSPSFPATVGYDTYGTLSVGGAATVLSGTTSTDGSGTTGISTESVWYNTPNSGDGSQGGVSSYYAEPSWQQFSSDANSVITGSSSITGLSSGRGTPDVAADGANMEIYITYGSSSGYQELWGTSIASPLTAGIVAVMDYYLGQKEGFMNPLVYRLAQAEYNGSYANAKPFYFISNGSNGAFSANNGYSLAVGWGSINAYNFVLAQTSSTSPPPSTAKYSVTFTESGLPSGTTWTVTLAGTTQSGTGSISFTEPNGSYSYTIGSVSGYTASPSSGTITVNGAAVTQSITFTATTTPSQQSMAVAQVNATASNTYTYNLPEAEEITPGSTSLSINYVSLYLSGSGTVDFGIGTSLWGDNVVPFTAVQVNSNEVWYNVSFPTVTLTGGSDYFLTVEGSGSILWGYASYGSTTVDTNALQDYWYSSPPSNGMPSGTPTNDNSYPDLFTVGYNAASTPVSQPSTYTVTFTESGLPSGTSWSVTLGGTTQSGTGSISFTEPNGSYSYSVSSSDKSYAPSSYTGTVTVSGSSVTTPVTFSEVTYPVTFTESGLPSGTTWSVTLAGTTQSGTGSISFTEPNGSYSYTIGSVSGYTASPSSGSVSVSGSASSVAIAFSAVSSSPNGVFAQVNATTSNTYYYTLPEAEEFDVSSTVQVDYITLNIEGSGTITVGIGTSVFNSNILANITLTVNVPNGGWINISFPAVTLNSGTHYFLNVNEPSGSGNVQWAYTSSPSVDQNALQDYWYSGSTLVNDNSYPDLFSIGYSSSAAVITAPHLPSNTSPTNVAVQTAVVTKH